MLRVELYTIISNCMMPLISHTHDQYCRNSYPPGPQGSWTRISIRNRQPLLRHTYSFRIALTTARVYGAVVTGVAMVVKARLAVA